jgi:regulatory protein
MSTITSIEPQVKDKNRCSIFIDGRFYCGIKLEVAIKYHLKSGMSIDKAELDKIQLDTEKQEALDRAMTHLSATPKTQKQMRDFLAKKGYTDAVCDYVIERLKYYNFLDDAAYCRAYVNSVHGKGKKALEADLIKRGADRNAIQEVLDETEEDDNEALDVLTKYMRGKQETKENYYKAFKYLLSKGFSYDTAKRAIEKAGDIDEDY